MLPPLSADLDAPLPWEPQLLTRGWQLTVGGIIGALWLLIDQATKALAAKLLAPAGAVRQELPGPITLQLTFNDGGANGYDAPWWFFIVVTIVVTVLVLARLPQIRSTLESIAYFMLLGGAWGNGLDRIFRTGDPGDPRFFHGHVVDSLASARFPTFNIADVAITLGFLLLMVVLFRDEGVRESAGSTGRPVPEGGS